ncbi:hypothetical protein KUCAC02_007046 [Chaenocephalus aceratus]|nr:hypothetical protein KUCAC02_007046 [Chaenocephalus aceratus]
MEPRFRKRDGIVSLTDTLEATKVKKSNKDRPWIRPLSLEEVMDKARTAITQHRGDPSNRRHLLGFFEIQLGLFRGQTFRWVVENSLGDAASLVAATIRDPTGGSLVHARARPTPHLIQLPVSFEAAKAPASALTHPAVSGEVDEANPADAGSDQRPKRIPMRRIVLEQDKSRIHLTLWREASVKDIRIGERVNITHTRCSSTDWPAASIDRKRCRSRRTNRFDPKVKSFEAVKKSSEDPLFIPKVMIFNSSTRETKPFLTLYQTDKPATLLQRGFVSTDES